MSNKQFSFGMSDAPKDFGTPPDLDPSDVYQYYPDTCAIRSQELILKDFGIDISQEDLIQQAIDHGWYEPGQGTSPLDVGKLLELNGVPVNQYENGNIFSLVNELAQGHKVIVGVDADELWNNGFDWKDMFGINSPNHALLVSNIDTTDPNNITVTLTDPGTSEVAKEYSFEQFEDAWRDSNCFVVATQDPAPPTADYMSNFDYQTGHLDTVFNGLPFEDFQEHFGAMFNMDVASEEFQNLFVDTVTSPELRIWASSWVGHFADFVLPGSGVPTTIFVNITLDRLIALVNGGDTNPDPLGGDIQEGPIPPGDPEPDPGPYDGGNVDVMEPFSGDSVDAPADDFSGMDGF